MLSGFYFHPIYLTTWFLKEQIQNTEAMQTLSFFVSHYIVVLCLCLHGW